MSEKFIRGWALSQIKLMMKDLEVYQRYKAELGKDPKDYNLCEYIYFTNERRLKDVYYKEETTGQD